MHKEGLDEIIRKIEGMNSREDAYFSSSYNDEFSYAKGNKDGLILYALEFLKAAKSIENRNFEQGDTEMYNPNFSFIKDHDETQFEYIQVTNKVSSEILKQKINSTKNWKDKAFGLGCAILLIFGLFMIMVGLFNFISWFI